MVMLTPVPYCETGFILLNFNMWVYVKETLLSIIAEFDLGKLQSGQELGDVILPPWATTPEDFIKKHREALVRSQYCHMILSSFMHTSLYFCMSIQKFSIQKSLSVQKFWN